MSNKNFPGTFFTSGPGVSAGAYRYPQRLNAKQDDPQYFKNINQLQDYSIIIRKKPFYVANPTDGGYENDYVEVYQVNNFYAANTTISTTAAAPGQLTVTIRGGEKVVALTKSQVASSQGTTNFSDLIANWNNINPGQGTTNYRDVLDERLYAKYNANAGWHYAEKCNWQPMDEIYLFGKNLNLLSGGNVPNNITPAFEMLFFGYIDSVIKSYQAGTGGLTISITASDQLKLLNLSYISVVAGADLATAGAAVSYDPYPDPYGNMIINDTVLQNKINTIEGIFAGMYPNEIIVENCLAAGINKRFLTERIEHIHRVPFLPNVTNASNAVGAIFQTNFQNRLQFCQTGASAMNLEFFADEQGNIVLKIPTFTIGINRLPANNLGYINPYYTGAASITGNSYTAAVATAADNVLTQTVPTTSTNTSPIPQFITYVVANSNEKLWDIAAAILGNAVLWRSYIYNYNRNLIPNIYNLQVGIVLQILNPKYKAGKAVTANTAALPNKVRNTFTQPNTPPSLAAQNDHLIPVIPPEVITGFTFQDSDANIYTFVQVTGELPMGVASQGYPPPGITRAVADYGLIQQFGFRPCPPITTPLIANAAGAEMYAAMILQRSVMLRYTATLTMIETPEVRVGQPVRFHIYDEYPFPAQENVSTPNDAVFYVSSIQRSVSINNGSVSNMTLTLQAGRVFGQPSIYDTMPEFYRYFYDTGLPTPKPKSSTNATASGTSSHSSGPSINKLTQNFHKVYTYIVKQGDSLWAIASTFYSGDTSKTLIQSIATYNNIASPNLIYPGKILKLQDPTSNLGQLKTVT